MENNFKIGDIVSLVSAPEFKMEVIKINQDGTYRCEWVVSRKEKRFEVFPGTQLMKLVVPQESVRFPNAVYA